MSAEHPSEELRAYYEQPLHEDFEPPETPADTPVAPDEEEPKSGSNQHAASPAELEENMVRFISFAGEAEPLHAAMASVPEVAHAAGIPIAERAAEGYRVFEKAERADYEKTYRQLQELRAKLRPEKNLESMADPRV